MKKALILFLFIIGVFTGIYFLRAQNVSLPQTNSAAVSKPQQSNVPSSSAVQRSGLPVRLEIPSIGVNASVESVGLDSQGRMDIPKSPDNVAWYNLGVRPGENGNAVIDGHLDSTTGPAVFYRLREIAIGNRLSVSDDQNHRYDFIVTDKKTYPFDAVPLKEIFGPADRPFLNLITCEGTFNSVQKNYSARTVIYTKLAQ